MTLGTPTVQSFIASSQVSQAPYGFNVTAVTSSFTPPANALLLVHAVTNAPTAVDAHLNATTPITDTAGLTWTRRAFKSSNAGSTGGAGQGGPSAEIWTAPVGGSPASMTVTVAYPTAASTSSWNIGGLVASITDSGGSVPVVGAVAGSSSASGTPTVTVAGVGTGSQVFACVADWADVTTGQTFSGTYTGLNGAGTNGQHNTNYAYHFFCLAANTSGSGSQAMTMSGPAAQNYDMVAVEVQPPSGGTTFNVSASATQAHTSTMVRSAALPRSVTQATTTALVRGVALPRSVTRATSPTVVRSVGLPRSTTQARTATTTRSVGLPRSATQATTATISRSIGIVRLVTQARTLTIAKAVSLTKTLTQGTTSSVIRSVILSRSATQGHTATTVVSRAFLITLSAVQAHTASLIRQAQLVRSVAQGRAQTLAKAVSLTKTSTQSSTPTVTRSIGLARVTSVVRFASAAEVFGSGGSTHGVTLTTTVGTVATVTVTAIFLPPPPPAIAGSTTTTVTGSLGSVRLSGRLASATASRQRAPASTSGNRGTVTVTEN